MKAIRMVTEEREKVMEERKQLESLKKSLSEDEVELTNRSDSEKAGDFLIKEFKKG